MFPDTGAWRRFTTRLGSLGSDPSDSEEVARAKRLLILSSVLIMVLSVSWVLLYWLYDEVAAALIPGAYIAVSSIELAVLSRNRQFSWFRDSQLALFLLLPFSLQLALGGFVTASAVIVWSLFAPLGALAFTGPSAARRWFLGYVGILGSAVLLESVVPAGNNLPESLRLGFFVMNVLGISIVTFVLLSLFVSQLQVERGRSDALLLNVLPARIARRLRLRPSEIIAERFEQASVLFADVVGFTSLTTRLQPQALVELLDQLFSNFDALADKHGIEKIKTIGDSYMVASGVPDPRPDHAQAIAEMALDVMSYCATHPPVAGRPLQVRIGIDSGPLVAGVIGRRKFIYDLWGDAVNTASRMESHGQPGAIQLTETAYENLKDDYVCEPHGIVEVKGKGPMPTWFLVGRREKKVRIV